MRRVPEPRGVDRGSVVGNVRRARLAHMLIMQTRPRCYRSSQRREAVKRYGLGGRLYLSFSEYAAWRARKRKAREYRRKP